MKKEVFLNLVKKQNPVSLYTRPEATDRFTVGFVTAVNAEQITIGVVDRYGNYDGYIVRNLDDVFMMEDGTQYLNKIKSLYKGKKQNHSLELHTEDFFEELLQYAKDNKKAVSIQLHRSDFTDIQGFVIEIADGNISFAAITEFGGENGVTHCLLEDITHISCDSQDEVILEILHKE